MCSIIPFPLNNLFCNKIPIFITQTKILFTRRHVEDVTVLTSFFYFQFLFLEHLQWHWGTDIPDWVFPLDKRFMNIFYVQWHYVFFLKINISWLDILSSTSTSRNSDWLINIQLCKLCRTLMAEQGNEGFYFRGTRQLLSKIEGNKGLIIQSTLI